MNGITISVTADTEQAGQSLENFATSGAAQLRQLRESSVLLRDTMRGTAETMLLLGGQHSQQLFTGFMIVRSGMMATRAAALAFNTSIANVIPAIGAAGVALAGGIAIWTAFRNAQQQAIDRHNEFVETLKRMPEIIGHIDSATKAGFLSPETQAKLLNAIGATRAELSQAAFSQSVNQSLSTSPEDLLRQAFPTANAQPGRMASLLGIPQQDDLDRVNEELTKAGFLLKEIGKDGKAAFSVSDKGEALIKIIELRNKLSLDTLSGYNKERTAAKQRYDEELAALNEYIARASDQLEKRGIDPSKLRADLLGSFNQTLSDIASKEQSESLQKAEEAYAKGQESFHKMVEQENQELDQKLNLQAAQAGKTREQIYQQEFAERMDLLTRQLYAGEIDEAQYTKSVQESTTKRLEGVLREQEEVRRLDELKQRLANQEANASRRRLVNPLLAAFGGGAENSQAQLGAINSQITSAMAEMQKQTEATFQPQSQQQQIENLQKRNELEEQLNKLLDDQARAQAAVDNARVEGVKNMFGNMAAAAKAFGQEGLAVYKGFAIAQATIDTAKAAIAAYSSVVGIPYIGPVLAVAAAAAAVAAGAAQIGEIESAQAREAGGPVTAGQLYMTGERGRELFTPTVDGHIFNAGETAQILGSAGNSGAGSTAINHKTELHLATFGGEADAKRWADSNEGETWFLNMMNKHAYRYNA